MTTLDRPLCIAIRREPNDLRIAASEQLDQLRPIDFAVPGSGWNKRYLSRLVRCLLIKIDDLRSELANAGARERELARRLKRASATTTEGMTYDTVH